MGVKFGTEEWTFGALLHACQISPISVQCFKEERFRCLILTVSDALIRRKKLWKKNKNR